jgi:glycosyltransferase involved in cell wall biosynthesis
MRIAMIAPLTEAVPPRLYGGTERVVAELTNGLVRRGHELTLFASGDSCTDARLVPVCAQSLRLDPEARDYIAHTLVGLGEVYRRASEVDIIHNHVDYLAFPFARLVETPTVTTTHGRLDLAEVRRLYRHFGEQPLISISHDQARSFPDVNWVGTIHHGIHLDEFQFRPDPGDYLVFLGRISPEKRPDRAIEIARDVGMRLIIAAKVDAVDRAYYEHAIAPLIDSSTLIEFVGEVNQREKDELLGGAFAYLFPIDWPEPFGLTMIEAMATGTPVIASRAGSVPEIVIDGVTGFVCDTVCAMVAAVARVGTLKRHEVRRHVETHFSADRMAADYEQIYREVVDGFDGGARVLTHTAAHPSSMRRVTPPERRIAMTPDPAEVIGVDLLDATPGPVSP